ncbi:neurotactin isoform X1 [Schistocerca nitens]|uniref:neurotactin isoform X1 n=2 Tax=Schistocerca nitens TaxID=7011 RepID=UPI00211921D7|nr:neurotactin isoform X1 [Schistocerca nitens]
MWKAFRNCSTMSSDAPPAEQKQQPQEQEEKTNEEEEQKKSEDKKEIEDEEREQMLNAENRDRDGGGGDGQQPEVGGVQKMRRVLEESDHEPQSAGKKKIPIGGIRIPGFLRSRSREKTKEGELDGEEAKDLLQQESGQQPQADGAGGGEGDTPRRPKLLPNPFAKKKEHELGAAGLASMETLDDSSAAVQDDGMESVKLDMDEKPDPEKSGADEASKQDWRQRLRHLSKFRLIIGGVALFVILLIIIVVIAASGPRRAPPVSHLIDGIYVQAVTGCGPVHGLVEEGAHVFRGIPYARQPVGDRRWQPAQLLQHLADCWNGTLRAVKEAPPCLQRLPNGTWFGSEDCLHLDLVTPRVTYDGQLPVIVLVGADTMLGPSPSALRTPSPELSRTREVVFVRPGFRLGPIGLLAAHPLSTSSRRHTSGNYALSDLIAALTWIQHNIHNFGGDPKAVTILAHRAGATMVTALATSKQAQKLFARAWLSSGSAIFPGQPLSESERESMTYLRRIRACEDNLTAGCLQSVDASELVELLPPEWEPRQPGLPNPDNSTPEIHKWLVLDGHILQRHVYEVLNENNVSVKMVIGTTAHSEGSDELHQRYKDWQINNETVKQLEQSEVGQKGLAEEAVRRYGTSWPGIASLVSDIRTVCPLLHLARQTVPPIPFYVVKQPRGEIADVDVDVDAILGRYIPRNTEQRRYVTAMQQVFYRFVAQGELRRREGGQQVLLIEQDANPSNEYPDCDMWLSKDIVPRYGRVD